MAFTELRRPTTTTTPKVEIGLGYKSRKRAGQRLQQTRRQEAFYFEHRRTAATLEKETSFLSIFLQKKRRYFSWYFSLSLFWVGGPWQPLDTLDRQVAASHLSPRPLATPKRRLNYFLLAAPEESGDRGLQFCHSDETEIHRKITDRQAFQSQDRC